MKNGKDQNEVSALAVELSKSARHAPARLGERIAALTIRQQAELALRLPPEARLELLLHAPKPMRLVRSLPDSEFHMTVREIGPEDALDLVKLGSVSQLNHLVDLESWHRDRFNADRAGAWLAIMLESGEPAIQRFLRSADDDLLALLFQQWIRVQPIVTDDDPDIAGSGLTEAGDETGMVSPDGFYRYIPSIEKHAAAIGRIMQVFFLDDSERYFRIIWSSLYELPSALEVEALRWRQSRLEEHGFPPWEDAINIYAPPAGITQHPTPLEPSDSQGLAAPRSPLRLASVRDQLRDALENLPDEIRDGVFHEIVGLANHLLVADGADTREPSEHRGALAKGVGYVNIALQARGADGRAELQRLLTEIPLIELFREGHARATDLQRTARELSSHGWISTHPRALELLDSPLRDRIEALLVTRPLYFEIGEETTIQRPFRSLAEIDETRVALEIVDLVGGLLVEHLGLDLAGHFHDDGTEVSRSSTMLLTVLAWHSARGELRVDPLPTAVASDFLRNVASRRTAAPDAPARSLEALVSALQEKFDLAVRQAWLLGRYGEACLEQLAEECSNVDPGVPVDPSRVSCLLIQRG